MSALFLIFPRAIYANIPHQYVYETNSDCFLKRSKTPLDHKHQILHQQQLPFFWQIQNHTQQHAPPQHHQHYQGMCLSLVVMTSSRHFPLLSRTYQCRRSRVDECLPSRYPDLCHIDIFLCSCRIGTLFHQHVNTTVICLTRTKRIVL